MTPAARVDWQAVSQAHTPNLARCVGCGRENGLALVSVAQGGAHEIVSVCDACRPWARGHFVDWLTYWARKDRQG
jgi:hypothetical protein